MRLPRVAWLVPVALFFLNPALACGDEPQFQYGAAEMRAAVEGTWMLTLTGSDGTSRELTVSIDQGTTGLAQVERVPGAAAGGLIRAAHACGTRTLVKSAGACVDVSQMPLQVAMVAGDPSFQGAPLSGTFTVSSLVFSFGEVRLSLGDRTVVFTLSADGVPSNPLFNGGTVTVTRQMTL